MSFPKYPEYKDSGVEWLGDVPAHWRIEPLKWHCDVMPSNVDKKSAEGEQPVLLCNYTDVYYNDQITVALDFMKATASNSQIDRFTIRQGDVVFTKDSESPEDIAVSAFVPLDLPGIVCGYHLAIARSHRTLIGKFLKWYFDSQSAKAYFYVSANGLTRVGLSQYASDNLPLPLPSLREQENISAFLDHETVRIDALVAEQQRLIELLKEKRQAAISHAVTKGLNPNVPMKDSGVEWLGEVPAHWTVGSLKHFLQLVSDVDHYMPAAVDSGVPYVMTGDLRRRVSEINLASCKQIAHRDFLKLARKVRTSSGDVIMARYATIGSVCYVDIDVDFVVSYSCVTIRPKPQKATGIYLYLYFQSDAFIQGISNMINANTQDNVGVADLKEVKVALPSLNEQKDIVSDMESELSELDRITETSKAVVNLLQERRSALISAAVTGKIDVRGWQPPPGSSLPTETTATEPA